MPCIKEFCHFTNNHLLILLAPPSSSMEHIDLTQQLINLKWKQVIFNPEVLPKKDLQTIEQHVHSYCQVTWSFSVKVSTACWFTTCTSIYMHMCMCTCMYKNKHIYIKPNASVRRNHYFVSSWIYQKISLSGDHFLSCFLLSRIDWISIVVCLDNKSTQASAQHS